MGNQAFWVNISLIEIESLEQNQIFKPQYL